MQRLTVTVRCRSNAQEHILDFAAQPNLAVADSGRLEVSLDGTKTRVDWAEIAPDVFSILVDGKGYKATVTDRSSLSSARREAFAVTVGTRAYEVEIRDPRARRPSGPNAAAAGPEEIRAPMPGKIVKILVAERHEVRAGQGLLVIEAMKMQNELRAPRAGRVEKVHVTEGTGVETGAPLVRLA